MDYNWLDLGCGDQIVPEWLQVKEKLDQHFKTAQNRVTGIDIFKENLKKNSSVKQKLLGNLENLPIKNDSYHFITANMVMEHIKNPDILLKEVNRILIPGGSFIFHTPNILNYAP
jgi:ubiquinone/menaquinone biosynthesis C-methylase UbiE